MADRPGVHTPLVTAAIDFDRLMEYPQDDATGLTAIASFCVRTLESVIHEYSPVGSGPETDIEFRALQLGGSKSINLALAADESGVILRGTLGTALLRSWMAPVVQMLDDGVSIPGDDM